MDSAECVCTLVPGLERVQSPLQRVNLVHYLQYILGSSNSHGARPVHLIITMIKRIRARRLSIKKSFSLLIISEDARARFVGRAISASVGHSKTRGLMPHIAYANYVPSRVHTRPQQAWSSVASVQGYLRNCPPLGLYSRTMPRALWRS